MSKNLMARLCVAAVAIPAILWISYQGGWWLYGMITLFALVAICEYLVAEGYRPNSIYFWLAFLTVASVFASFAAGFFEGTDAAVLGLMTLGMAGPIAFLSMFMISSMILALGKEEPAVLFQRASRLFWGVAYVGMLYPFVMIIGIFGSTQTISSGDLLLFLFG
ncbi:MAG: hypothetical protein GY867_00230, partial [bacterium]|nr:hypothetical protein [bacterium]